MKISCRGRERPASVSTTALGVVLLLGVGIAGGGLPGGLTWCGNAHAEGAQTGGGEARSDHHHHVAVPKGLDTARTKEFDFDPPAPGSYRLPIIRAAADGRVLDTQGHSRSLHEVFDGKIVLLSFIYTRCTDARGCPLATAVLYKIFGGSRSDPELAANLRMLSLSFDPEHDTPEVMAGYRHGSSPEWSGGAEWLDLTTASNADLQPILTAYEQVVRRRVDEHGNPTDAFGHQLRAYLIDRHQRIRNIYGLGFLDPRLLIADVRTLLAEEKAAGN
jgi:cytochrome oxidase Cu insertion factor (SCO1/SenC/PrrC family)